MWIIEITAIVNPSSTCQYNMLNGNRTIIPLLIRITSRIPRIADPKKVISRIIFQKYK